MCLICGFGKTVSAGGKDVPIKTDFRVWLTVDRILKSSAAWHEKIAKILGSVYIKLPDSLPDAVYAAMEFYNPNAKKASSGGSKKSFDFEYDGELIYAAFLQQYGIDLLKENIHWHKFLALLSCLGDETAFVRTVRIRNMDLSEVSDVKRRGELLRLKRSCALPLSKNEEKENEELILSLTRRKVNE